VAKIDVLIDVGLFVGMNAPVKIVIYLIKIDALKFLNLIGPNVVSVGRQIDADFYAEDTKLASTVKWQMIVA
jgi:hypothetical protein